MTDTKFIEEVKKDVAQINEIKQQLVDKLKPRFKDLFIPFLTKYPQVKEVRWTQYTPYFNDGESCEFSVNELNGFIDPNEESEEYDECDYEGTFPMYSHYIDDYGLSTQRDYAREQTDKVLSILNCSIEELKEINNDFLVLQEAFESIDSDTMQSIFGDHAIITVTLAGIDCEEYDHE